MGNGTTSPVAIPPTAFRWNVNHGVPNVSELGIPCVLTCEIPIKTGVPKASVLGILTVLIVTNPAVTPAVPKASPDGIEVRATACAPPPPWETTVVPKASREAIAPTRVMVTAPLVTVAVPNASTDATAPIPVIAYAELTT